MKGNIDLIGLIDCVRSLVLRECSQRKISVRQFLIEIGENGRHNWDNLIRSLPAFSRSSFGKYVLLFKLLKYYDLINYDNKTKNSL